MGFVISHEQMGPLGPLRPFGAGCVVSPKTNEGVSPHSPFRAGGGSPRMRGMRFPFTASGLQCAAGSLQLLAQHQSEVVTHNGLRRILVVEREGSITGWPEARNWRTEEGQTLSPWRSIKLGELPLHEPRPVLSVTHHQKEFKALLPSQISLTHACTNSFNQNGYP